MFKRIPLTHKKMRTWLKRPFAQHLILLVLAALLALCVGCALLLPRQFVLASTLALSQARSTGQTCADSPSPAHCTRQDPIRQGCTADAVTLRTVPIVHLGVTVGRLDERFSGRCHAYWGRCFSFSPGYATVNMLSPYTENVTGPYRGNYLAAYTDMVFGQPPALQGIIGFSATDEAQAYLS